MDLECHIRQLKTWHEPTLLTKPPLQDMFACWRVLSPTRSKWEQCIDEFVEELKSQGFPLHLQHWADLAFNSYSNYDPRNRILADSLMLRVFIKIQWCLFNGEDPTLMLQSECTRRGIQYAPTITTQPATPASQAPERNLEKGKGRAALVKKFRKQRLATRGSIATKSTERSGPKTQQTGKAGGQQAGPRACNRTKRLGREQAESAALNALRKEKREKYKKQKLPQLTRSLKPVKSEEIAPDLPQNAVLAVDQFNEEIDNSQPNGQLGEIPQAPPTTLGGSNANGPSSTPTRTFPGGEIADLDDVKPAIFPLPSGQKDLEYPPNWLEYPTEDPEIADISFEDHQLLPSSTKMDDSVAALPPNLPPAVKPPPPRYPPIWAQSRQEVCESFDWFRAYQSGVYHSRNVARGYLLSAFSAKRDIFHHGGKLIISHGGGKAQSVHSRRGQHVTQEAADQLAQDKSVRALLANYRYRRPLVLLIDDRYILFPYDLGVRDITYAVLGFYTIVHAWAEYQPSENERGRVVRYKFAFQWCESQGDPWWWHSTLRDPGMPNCQSEEQPSVDSPMEEPDCTEESFAPSEHTKHISSTCCLCLQASPRVYESAWACLNPNCLRFWQDVHGRQLEDNLEYNSQFLQLVPNGALAVPLEKLEPGPPLLTSQGLTTDYAYTRGWHCKNCGRLSCRYKWEHWECMNCKAILKAGGRIHQAAEFFFLTPSVSFREVFIAKDSGIERLGSSIFPIRLHDGSFGKCQTYKLPGGRGFIHHIKTGNPHWNWEADEIFQEYQAQASTGALPFRRWPMRAHKCRGALLTNYFSQNAGVPYQYVGGTENTLPFDKVPEAVVGARNLIQTRIKQALNREAEFNEVLSAAYMERQRMAFHTDDEKGLGPLVAGLSLGSPALMHFRLLSRHAPQGMQRSIAASFVLRHGDILAMDGAGVQQFYEHTVVPTNFRIAATARYIDDIHPKREKS